MRKFNQFKGYKGKYKGKLLTPMQYCQFGKPKDFVMSNRQYYKRFCQFDHMEQDKDFMWYLKRFVISNPRTGKGLEHDKVFKHLYNKLKYITLNDIYNPNEEDSEIGCCSSGNKLTDWEQEQINNILKDYVHFFRKHRNEILEECYQEDELNYLEERELTGTIYHPYSHNREDEYLTKDLFTDEYLKDGVVASDDDLPF